VNETERNYKLRLFYEQVAEKYPEEMEVYTTLRGILRKEFIEMFLMDLRGKVLEIGCNRGMYLEACNKAETFGADISLNVLRWAAKHRNLRVVQADAENLTCFKAGTFDHILCSEVLEHCFQPDNVFRSIRYLLKPGGTALITTPNWKRKKPVWADTRYLEIWGIQRPFTQGYIHTAFRPEELEGMSRQSGFFVLESGTLEKDVKYAAKLPVILWKAGNIFRFLGNRWIVRNEHYFQRFSLFIYRFCKKTGLRSLLLKFIKEGVRSYVLLTPSENK
jgi:2-polyprenyl-3-methyl-5-hydroxy-6-metoxy-1,4-benzoquinol methylase